MTRRARWVTIVVLALLAALPLLLLTSETALRAVADAVTQRVPALEIVNLRGTLLTGVSAERVTWHDARATVDIERLSARWRILPALTGRLHLDRVAADSVGIALAPSVPPPPDAAPRRGIGLPARIAIPLVIRARELAVDVVTVSRADRVLFAVAAVAATDVYIDPETFSATRLAAVGERAAFEASGTVEPAGSWPVRLDTRWRVRLPGLPQFNATLSIDGALDAMLALAATADSQTGTARFTGNARGLLSTPSVRGRLAIDNAQLERWHAASPQARVSADLALDGWVEDLSAVGTASLTTPGWPAAVVDADIHWGHRLLAVRRAAVRSDAVATTIEGSGHFDWSAENPAGTVRAAWRSLRWPLGDADGLRSDDGTLSLEFANTAGHAEVDAQLGANEVGRVRARADVEWLDAEPAPRITASADWTEVLLAGVGSDHGRISVAGTPDQWAGMVTAALTPPGVPTMALSANATGGGGSLRATDVHVDWLDGVLDGTVALSWSDGLRASANLVLARIDLGKLRPDWAGRIDGRVDAQLQSVDGVPRWHARLHDATGTLGERSFDARADARGGGATLDYVDAAARVGDAEAELRGKWAPELEVAWRVDAPDIGLLLPDASGSIRGRGFLRGDPATPAFEFDVSGEDLAYGGFTVARVTGEGDVDLAGVRATHAVLRLDALNLDGRPLDTVELAVSGPPHALAIGLDTQADATRVRARLSGAWNADRFDGRIDVAELVHGDEAPWRLQQPAPLRFGARMAHADEACWRQQDTPNELCVEGVWHAGVDARVRAALSGLPLAELSAWLPLGFQYSGRVGGEASFAWTAGGEPEAEGRLSVTDGAWRQLVGGESVALLQWSEASIEGRLRDGAVDAETAFTLVDGGQLAASLHLPVTDTVRGTARQRPLRARFEGGFSDFDLLPALVPDIGAVTGRVRANLTVSGTLDEPLFAGEIAIDDGTTTIPRLGIRLTDLGIAVSGNRSELGLRGRARSGDGTLALDGRFSVSDGRLVGEFDIQGENFEAANMPEARVMVSPQLTVAIAGHGVNVDGEVRIPSARLAPRDFEGVVNASPDEILLDEATPDDDAEKWRIGARVRIAMGDVVFTGFGLSGNITGSLTAIDTPGHLTRATGELQIRDGRYQAWGQTLNIEYGRLIFTGGPITEPGVDVLAVRRPQDVTVGVRVRGTLRNPELRLHSEPPMTQSEQLSWLVLGAPLTRATGSEQALIDRTRNTAGLAGGEFVARQLGHRLGLSDVGIDRGSTPEETALVIGHYLSPRLYIGYGIGIFDPANSLRFRYHIDSNWSIEVETGERATSTDLKFTVER